MWVGIFDYTQRGVALGGLWLTSLLVSVSHGYQSSVLITHRNPRCPPQHISLLRSPLHSPPHVLIFPVSSLPPSPTEWVPHLHPPQVFTSPSLIRLPHYCDRISIELWHYAHSQLVILSLFNTFLHTQRDMQLVVTIFYEVKLHHTLPLLICTFLSGPVTVHLLWPSNSKCYTLFHIYSPTGLAHSQILGHDSSDTRLLHSSTWPTHAGCQQLKGSCRSECLCMCRWEGAINITPVTAHQLMFITNHTHSILKRKANFTSVWNRDSCKNWASWGEV